MVVSSGLMDGSLLSVSSKPRPWRSSYFREWRRLYPEKYKESIRKYRETHKDELRERDRARRLYHRRDNLKRCYGLTLSDYEELCKLQGNACAICQSVVQLCVDHDHNTGKVRGLLCRTCNSGLGFLKHNPTVLRMAADYLERTT